MDYNLKIDDMTKVATSGSLSDVVVSVNYTIACTGSNEGTSSYHLINPKCSLGTVESSSFIAYSDLTDDIVKSWVTGSSDWSVKLSNAEAQVSSSIWPEVTTGLPWGAE